VACDRAHLTFGSNQQHDARRMPTPFMKKYGTLHLEDFIGGEYVQARTDGFKHSGYGKDLSMYGLEDYTRIKHVMANIES
jgi:acyl-CoA reductase-like NAD-dependent aldehyde dehydrogenase